MRCVAIAVILASISTEIASAETFRFPANARAAHGVPQVEIAWSVYMPPGCAGRWSVDYPAGFTFSRGAPNSGNLRGNPGRGSYHVALKTEECRSWNSDYVQPPRTTWHKVVVY